MKSENIDQLPNWSNCLLCETFNTEAMSCAPTIYRKMVNCFNKHLHSAILGDNLTKLNNALSIECETFTMCARCFDAAYHLTALDDQLETLHKTIEDFASTLSRTVFSHCTAFEEVPRSTNNSSSSETSDDDYDNNFQVEDVQVRVETIDFSPDEDVVKIESCDISEDPLPQEEELFTDTYLSDGSNDQIENNCLPKKTASNVCSPELIRTEDALTITEKENAFDFIENDLQPYKENISDDQTYADLVATCLTTELRVTLERLPYQSTEFASSMDENRIFCQVGSIPEGFPKEQRSISINAKNDGGKPFSCSTCGKGFQSRRMFESHKLSHDGKTKMCSTCGKVLTLYVESHLLTRTHCDEEPYNCTTCTKECLKAKFKVGEKVNALIWKSDGQHCPGVIIQAFPEQDSYEIQFDDGIKSVKKSNEIKRAVGRPIKSTPPTSTSSTLESTDSDQLANTPTSTSQNLDLSNDSYDVLAVKSTATTVGSLARTSTLAKTTRAQQVSTTTPVGKRIRTIENYSNFLKRPPKRSALNTSSKTPRKLNDKKAHLSQSSEKNSNLPDVSTIYGPRTKRLGTIQFRTKRPTDLDNLEIPPPPESGYRLKKLYLEIDKVTAANIEQVITDPEGIIFNVNDPVPEGWRKEAQLRFRGEPYPKWYISYVSPEGDRFRYLKQMYKVIKDRNFDFTPFDFRPLNPRLQEIAKKVSGGNYHYKRRKSMPPPPILSEVESFPGVCGSPISAPTPAASTQRSPAALVQQQEHTETTLASLTAAVAALPFDTPMFHCVYIHKKPQTNS